MYYERIMIVCNAREWNDVFKSQSQLKPVITKSQIKQKKV